MNNTDKIRNLLNAAIEYKGDYAYSHIIKKCKEVLALLSCETCGGTEHIPTQIPPGGDIDFNRCPDCKEKKTPTKKKFQPPCCLAPCCDCSIYDTCKDEGREKEI